MDKDFVLNALAEMIMKAAGPDFKHTTPTGTPSTPYVHGPGGIFGTMGLERQLIHTHLGGSGLAAALPVRPSNSITPLFPYITGFRDVSGSDADGVCDDGIVAGPMKGCLQTAPFGRKAIMTREVELTRIGQEINRGEMFDLNLVNVPLARQIGSRLYPTLPNQQQALRGAEVLQRFLEVGIAYERWHGPLVYAGTTANNSAGNGYREYNGLDLLIGTGKIDAETATLCPSLDSIVWDYGYNRIDDADATPNLVTLITNIIRRIKHIAFATGMTPLTLAMTMRQDMFWEITDFWPCYYYTNRCQSVDSDESENVLDSERMVTLRDDMRNNNYLLVDGEKIRVIVDPFLAEESSDDTDEIPIGCFASDINIVPLMARGIDTLYFEHYDYRAGSVGAIVDGRAQSFFWTDGGAYLWHTKPPLNTCLQWQALTLPRLVLRTPHLAARIEDVVYCPLEHSRDILPSQDYFKDGGVTDRPEEYFYHESQLPTEAQ